MAEDKRNPLDLVRGHTGDAMIAEFPDQVGSIQFSEPGPLAPGFQGGLFKAQGEGTRGGHVVGHTASGKPIYASSHEHGKAFANAHKHFSAKDHFDAAQHHVRAAQKEEPNHNYHARMAQAHQAVGIGKQTGDHDFGTTMAHHHVKEAGTRKKKTVIAGKTVYDKPHGPSPQRHSGDRRRPAALEYRTGPGSDRRRK